MAIIPEDFQSLIESTAQAARQEDERLYREHGKDVMKADLHYLEHEKLEQALDRIGVEGDEKEELRREIGRPLHLAVELGKIGSASVRKC